MTGNGKIGNRAFIGLGSNMGDRMAYLETALREITAQPGIRLVKASSYYESEPVGYRDQDWFINRVVEVETTLAPLELLRVLQGIENRLGRKRLIRWGPRVIDLDLLLYGDLVLTGEELTVPHERMYERNFVLIPLNEIAPEYRHPDGRTTAEHLQAYLATAPPEKIRLWTG
ncbi:MAG TPA: 2-amino-4-hydroxy-6-hydroxymethyldihydropteridine diphosphokinase [Syntrophomonadaceae bacterium]|nr:2-amino-4-hydroxy-6-hydroxymethyldihydropteridine diphosphokinase [Syntrophomonadaceae bacterium]